MNFQIRSLFDSNDQQPGCEAVQARCCRARAGLWVLATLALQQTAFAQLAITEAMSASARTFQCTNTVQDGPDYWELSNFGTNALDLTGYRFNDSEGGLNAAHPLQEVVIQGRESVVFFEGTISAEAFRAWWGLGTNVQVIPYPGGQNGLSANGDSILLWGPSAADEADIVDAVSFGPATPGHSFTFDSVTGAWGVSSRLNIDGAVRAATADDVGSPGTSTGPVALSFLEQPAGAIAHPGDAVTFSARHGGLPRPGFQWFREGAPIPSARQPDFTVTNAQASDAGAYFVVISNSFQSVTSLTATLTLSTIPVPPLFIESPADLWIFPDQEATFRSLATGLPQPGYQWHKNGVAIPGATSRTLHVHAPHEIGTNIYSVVARNTLGAATNEATLLVFERPDLRITELMAREQPLPVGNHEDWWELTNFGTNAVDLFGYRFDDFTHSSVTDGSAGSLPRLKYAWVLTNHVLIQPGESIVFVESMTAEEFRQWWGWTNLPPTLQIITYIGGGLSFSQSASDGLGLWNMGATRDDDFVNPYASAGYSALDVALALGVCFTIDPDIPDDTCCYQFCVPGVNGASVAAEGGDIGSPGYIRTPADPRIVSLEREAAGWRLTWRAPVPGAYRVEWRASLTTGGWTDLATVHAIVGTATCLDATAPSGTQRFYRVVREP